mmetsp:Transcript_4000/g.8864  ORF Transcript_4000/g.8864 Transcript_4000/m.8864 type:complete len:165 (-) Transcript_4000:188-682(-)
MEDKALRSLFIVICESLMLDTDVVSQVYDTIVSKTVHARFAVVFRQWKEANVKRNGQVAFRTKLKAQNTKTEKKAVSSPASNSSIVSTPKRKDPPSNHDVMSNDSRKRQCTRWVDLNVPKVSNIREGLPSRNCCGSEVKAAARAYVGKYLIRTNMDDVIPVAQR